MKKIIAIVMVVLGAIVLVYGGISYDRERTVLDMGGMKATVTENKNIPIAPFVGAIVLIGGIAFLVTQRRVA